MTDHDHELLKWVAEELLGWKPKEGEIYLRQSTIFPANRKAREAVSLKLLQSWHGIGLVVEAMDHREDVQEIIRFNRYLEECLDTVWWMLPMPYKCYFVFEAARKAVTGD